MRRGTTPTFIFQLDTPDLDLSTLTQVWVTIDDGRNEAKTWDISSVTIDNDQKQISLFLTQAETLALSTGIAKAQIRMLTSEGVALATTYSTIEIHDILKKGVIE